MTRRRGRGEGSVFCRKDGTWCAALTTGYDATGHRKRRHVYGETKAAVLVALAGLQHQSVTGTLGDPSRLTVAGFLGRWLEDDARPSIRPTTYRSYSGIISLHVNPQIGGVALSTLTPAHVQHLLTAMEGAGASARLRQLTYAVLHRALNQAARWNMIPRNVCDAVTRPRVARKAMHVLTAAQVGDFLKAAHGDRLEVLYGVAVSTGLRWRELAGLAWTGLDLQAGIARIQRQMTEGNGHPALAELKTARSRRQIQLPDRAIVALRQHRQRQFAELGRQELVFTDTRRGPLRASNVLRQSFVPLLEHAGLAKREKDAEGREHVIRAHRFHDLRHTAATLPLQQNVNPKIVSEILGHSQIALTLDTYSHVLPSMQQDAAAKMDALLGEG